MKRIFFTVFCLLMIFAVTHAQSTEPYIAITTNKAIGDSLKLKIRASNTTNEQLIWIDLNGNGQKDPGEQVTSFSTDNTYVKSVEEIRIYGPVWTFTSTYSQLTSLTVSANHNNLNQIWCAYNQIEELDLSNNTSVSYVSCQSNKLKRIVFNSNSKIKTVSCRDNELESAAMTELIHSLPVKNAGDGAELIALDVSSNAERNIVNWDHINMANAKNWIISNYNNGSKEVYNPTDLTKEVLRAGLYSYYGWGNTYPQNNITDPEVTILSKVQTAEYENWHIKYLVDVVGDMKEYSYGYLLLPTSRGDKPLPLVLALHPTSDIGKDRVMGIYANEPTDDADKYLRDARQYAHELGVVGDFIVFAPDRAGYGERRLLSEDIPYTEQMTAYQTYLRSLRPGWRLTSGKNVWDIQRALDFLLEYDFVDSNNVGAIGHSLGAADAMMLIASDDRVKTSVVNSGSNLLYREDLWTQDDILRDFVNNANKQALGEIVNLMVMLTAGKSLLYNWSMLDLYDKGGPYFLEGYRTMSNVINEKWRQYGITDLSIYMHSKGHDFPAEARALSYEWLKDKLKSKSQSNPPTAVDVVKQKSSTSDFQVWGGKGSIHLKRNETMTQQSEMFIYNPSGQVVMRQTIKEIKTIINIPKGIYIVKLDSFSEKLEVK